MSRVEENLIVSRTDGHGTGIPHFLDSWSNNTCE